MKNAINAVLSCILLAYPFTVYFLLDHTTTRVLGLVLLVILASRYYLLKDTLSTRQQIYLLVIALVFFLSLFLLNSLTVLKLYPVLINLCLLLVFVMSLLHPPTAIERIARLTRPNLPPQAISYTRNVTILWCVFFLFNLTISALLALFGTFKAWTLYVGLISYLLIFTLIGLELLYRRLYINPDET